MIASCNDKYIPLANLKKKKHDKQDNLLKQQL